MTRLVVLTCFTLALTAPTRASAQPGLPLTVQIIDAKIEKGKLTWTETKVVPIKKEIAVEVVLGNGTKIIEKRAVFEYVEQAVVQARELKGLKATDAAGKAIDAEKLAERLKDTTPVVLTNAALPEKHRALFKDKTVFIEIPVVTPVPVPVPAAPAVAPAM